MNSIVAALRFFFTHTLDRPDLGHTRRDILSHGVYRDRLHFEGRGPQGNHAADGAKPDHWGREDDGIGGQAGLANHRTRFVSLKIPIGRRIRLPYSAEVGLTIRGTP